MCLECLLLKNRNLNLTFTKKLPQNKTQNRTKLFMRAWREIQENCLIVSFVLQRRIFTSILGLMEKGAQPYGSAVDSDM